MKLLTIGYGLPNIDIDNYNVFNSPSYFDYDAMLVDPAGITNSAKELLDGEKTFDAHDGRAVVNGATTAASVSAADQIQRRADEARHLLESGGVIVVMGRPNATIGGIIGNEGTDRYSWLPAPAGVAWGPPLLRAAEGKRINIADDTHPLADLMREYRRSTAYRATLDELHPAVRQHGRIIARGGGNAPIAVEFSVLAGRVIFIPVLETLQSTARQRLAQDVVDSVGRLLGAESSVQPPFWAKSIAVPGLEQAEAELDTAEKAAKEASDQAAGARARHADLVAHRRLLWADGREYNRAVRAAFEALGFQVTSPFGEPLVVTDDSQTAYVEAASSPDAVVEWPYVHLQRRLEEHLLAEKEQLKGIVVVNAFRKKKPEERKEPFTEALRIACENYRYALMTTDTLFALVQRSLGGAAPDELAGIRRRLLRSAGLVTLEAALGEQDTGRQAGTVF